MLVYFLTHCEAIMMTIAVANSAAKPRVGEILASLVPIALRRQQQQQQNKCHKAGGSRQAVAGRQ